MKINNIIVTFWFNKMVDIKNKIGIFESGLKEYFNGINSIGVPADINPEYPRLSAISDGGHTTLNISMINARIMTKFDNLYCADYSKCFDYIEERLLKVFDILTSQLDLDVLYGAILISCEIDNENPVSSIKSKLLSTEMNNNYSEVGVKTTEILNDKFYKNIAINSTKQISLNKRLETNNMEIILPLVSLANSTIERETITINYEINDKYSFDNSDDYKLNLSQLNEIVNIAKEDINNKISMMFNK